ncbi:hypothetical protein SELSPUOL_00704 [Selenomonas sputigena ATCC 35185]|uniref:Rpn family recombination-promoting nuclease/putative transposase n=2 Tax=Selenomonas sputigena (strain ATCC 35185 / DSM 20758 / CCUG 44933 / VPI D19B-28) TaxID=546271 RepID=C9LTC1_SELS3|nr:hypothetical protein SELSPUOL_00704 [Selenomonas sputigena ATCC 35185]
MKKRGGNMDGYKIKPWEELTIRDDYMFKLVMKSRRICKKMLEGTLRIRIAKIRYLETEKSIAAPYRSKGIRLDVYVKDEKDTVYNIEMQVRRLEGDALFKRVRYYQSMMDADLLAAGADYDELNKTIIIFICPFDPFGEGRYIYTFENLCMENKELELRDGATKIFLNTKGTIGDITDTIKAFLRYVDGVVTDNSLVQEIEEEIRKVKLEEGERVNYMTFAMKMMEERKEGRAEGRREGRREGRKEGQRDERVAILRRLVMQSQIPVEQALEMIGIPQAEQPSYKKMLQATL